MEESAKQNVGSGHIGRTTPKIIVGYIGLSHMLTRSAHYANGRISTPVSSAGEAMKILLRGFFIEAGQPTHQWPLSS